MENARIPTRLALAFPLAMGLLAAVAGARQEGLPQSRRLALAPLSSVPVLELAPVERELLLARDATQVEPGPLPFAEPVDVDVTPQSSGLWEPQADGGRIWRLRVYAPGATDLNFGFTRYELPAGATLHVQSEARDYYQGPYTDRDNEDHGELWTAVVPGERAVLELYLPAATDAELRLRLQRVGAGYRDVFASGLQRQGSCNVDVICPEGEAWRDQIRSVALYSIGGYLACSGQMIADASHSFRGFFLTAAHCGVHVGNASSVVVYWNYESPNCGDLGGGTLDDNQTGAVWRTSRADVDFTLLELEEPPDASFSVFYTGWDRSGSAPPGGVGIHHPGGEEKAISSSDDLLISEGSCIGPGTAPGYGLTDTHWFVADWDLGTTEPGSSGSGLWHPDNQRLIGFLSGGNGSCGNERYSCYGKLSVAWDGPGPTSRLRDWLDSEDTGATMIDGSDPSPVVYYVSHQGRDRCSSDPALENGVWEPGEVIQVPVILRGTETFADVTGTLTSSAPAVAILDAVASWGSVPAGVDTESEEPHFTIRIPESESCGTWIDFGLEIIAGGGTEGFQLGFSHPLGAVPDVPKSIPDNGGDLNAAVSTLAVGADVVLSDVDVRVKIAHNWVADLKIVLRSPQGIEVVLLDRPGVPPVFLGCGDDDLDVIFDDDSEVDLEGHCAETQPWYSGVASPLGSLSDYAGASSRGTWTLLVSDHDSRLLGTLMEWELLSTPAVGGTCSICRATAIFLDGFESGDTTAWSSTSP